MPQWPGDPPTKLEKATSIEKDDFFLQKLEIGEHSGTHVGTAAHLVNNGRTMDRVPVEHLVQKCVCLDVHSFDQNRQDFLITKEHILQWEEKYGEIQDNHYVLIYTGWSRFWHEPKKYFGDESDPHFPGVSGQAADFLIAHRNIIGLGIDSPGIDGGQAIDFATNKLLAQNDCYHLENLTNLHFLPPTGALLFIGALSLKGGSGTPCRVLAMWKK